MNDMSNTPTEGNIANDMIALMQDMLKWEAHIDRALRDLDGMYTFNDVVAKVLRQEVQFYDFGDACAFCQVEEFPGYNTYHLFLACGNFDTMLEVEPQIINMAANLGCKYLSLAGRKGWERRLKSNGWKPVLSIMHKEI